ncbi:glycoside hydrolase family 74 protein [Microdochium trichocladiopsis]|uniref:Glycoside hydrolase family 74 protein n=1 Tax=Microdochium trichocladiopsis TaxID=1682393 RepID=A0A9P8YFG5_9PEZI|nr:glycoside hydrolase family 74 protein [Microdochium trichocladiopsis]KAH7036018.1 glycoside hydrolase family 74 protein [Microdochium trichocladiopsis]
MKFAALCLAATQAAQAAFTWNSARFGGGGGFVPGIVFHPTAPGIAYARTDIGGVYRLNSDDSWTPITDSLADTQGWHNWGADALAVDPQKPDVVYFAAGLYTNSWDPSPGAIFKSTDRGATWTSAPLKFKVGGNMPGRGMGERLAVDPSNSNIVYFGARSGNGLWKSSDAGKSFAKVDSFTAVGTYIPVPGDTTGYNSDIIGLSFVAFDSTSALVNGATSRIFVGTADNTTASVYVSEDAGKTWSAVPGQPKRFFPHKCKLSPEEGALYLSYADGAGPYDGTSGAVWRYDLKSKTWTDITPVSGSDLTFGFGGLALDAKKPGTIVVATLNSWWPDAQIYRSVDSGKTWSVLWKWGNYPEMIYYYGISTPKAPWIRKDFLDVDSKWLGWMIESFEIDPHDSDHFLYGTGLTVYGGHDLTKWDSIHNITIQSLADGIEETAVLEVASAPGGSELLAAVGDVSGYTFAKDSDLGTSPKNVWDGPKFTSTGGVDYAGNSPSKVVRVGNDAGAKMVALSTDGGISWAIHGGADTTNNGGSVAYSADGDIILWSTASGGVVRSQNEGAFAAVAALGPASVIAADRRNNSYFYAGSAGSFLVSADGGKTFAKSGTLTGATAIRDISAHPAAGGKLYVSTDAGIFYSEDFGKSFAALAGNLKNTYQVALGRGSGTGWNLYAFGTGSNGARLYGSADGGSSWTDIQGGAQGFGSIEGARLAGSGNVANKVYVGTNGRGVFHGVGALVGGGGGPSTSSSQQATKSATSSSSSKSVTSSSSVSTSSSTLISTTKTSSAPPPVQTAGPYERCGGSGWTGPTACASGYICKLWNEFYAQCVPK